MGRTRQRPSAPVTFIFLDNLKPEVSKRCRQHPSAPISTRRPKMKKDKSTICSFQIIHPVLHPMPPPCSPPFHVACELLLVHSYPHEAINHLSLCLASLCCPSCIVSNLFRWSDRPSVFRVGILLFLFFCHACLPACLIVWFTCLTADLLACTLKSRIFFASSE